MQQRVTGAAVALALVLAACGNAGPSATVHGRGGDTRIALEIAATPAERERGLMYRSSLADGRGMLFVFERDEDHEFWMKNTLIPLDMLFIAADGRVAGIHASATPLSTVSIAVGQPSRYVLEVPGGYAQRRGIEPGDRVELIGVGAVP